MGDSQQPNSDPPRKSVIITLASLVLVVGVVLVLALRPPSWLRDQTEIVTDESPQSVTPASPEAPATPVRPPEIVASAPVSAGPADSPPPQPHSVLSRLRLKSLLPL